VPYKDPVKRAEYNRNYQRKYYQSQKDKYKQKSKERRQAIRKWFDEVRSNTNCLHCGLSGAECAWLIEYHHRDPELKEDEVAFLVGGGYSIERIEREMAKCDPLCPNCHRKFHWEEKIAKGISINALGNKSTRKPTKSSKNSRARRKRKQRERNARKKAKSDNSK
jgi:hypothetical protein